MADFNSFGRGNVMAMTRKQVDVGGAVLTIAGAPSNGASGTFAGYALPGTLLVDVTNKKLYQNTNTKASPTWGSIGDVDAAEITLAQGRVLVGNAGGVGVALNSSAGGNILVGNDTTMVALDASDDAKLLLGNGTTITSAAMSGDTTISNAGVVAIGAAKVTQAMLSTALQGSAAGLGNLRMARATFDPSANAGQRTISAHDLGVTIPDNGIVVGGFIDVVTTFTSDNSDAATIAISVEGANDIVSAVAIEGGSNVWDEGFQAIIPKSNTPQTTSVKTTAARAITATVAVEALLLGKAEIFLHYVVSS
jgi:hypothetical protein